MRPITIILAPSATATNNISLAQTLGAAGNLLLNGSTGGVLEIGRIISLNSGATETAVITLTGLDSNGNVISEILADPSNSTVFSTLFYKTVTKISFSAASVGTIIVGTTATTLSAASAWIPMNFYDRIASDMVVEVSGTANYTVQETFDPIISTATSSTFPIALAQPAALVGKTATASSSLDVSITGIRLVLNSYSTGAVLTARIISALNFGG